MNFSVTKRFAYGSAAIFLFLVSLPVFAAAGAKIKIDDTKFFQIGMGYRGSLTITEDNAPDGTDSSFNKTIIIIIVRILTEIFLL